MLISDIVKAAGKELWPLTEGEPWQLEIIQRVCNATAQPLLAAIIEATKTIRELNETKEAAVAYGRRLPELENYLDKQKQANEN